MSVTTIARKIDDLEKRAGHRQTKIRPVYELVEEDGTESGTVDIEGRPVAEVDPGRDAVMTIHAGIFRELIKPQKFIVLTGGRGSARSHSVARYLLGLGIVEPARFLMTREVQSSLKESVHYLLQSIIDGNRLLAKHYTVLESGIIGRNGSEFIFRGIRDFTADSLKSLEAIRYAWTEEAQSLSRRSLDTLTPTVRTEGARLFFTLNPTRSTDPVYHDFVEVDEPRTDAAVSHWTIDQNPLVAETLKSDAENLKKRDYERWLHVYAGGLELYSDSRIFSNFVIKNFDIGEIIAERKKAVRFRRDRKIDEARTLYLTQIGRVENDFLIGADFGFSDPSCAVRLYVDPQNEQLFICDEVFESSLGPDGIADLFKRLPRVSDRWPIYCDNARPGLILHLKQRGINALPAVKLNLTDRIDGLKRWSIFIHPKCENTIREFGLFSWKKDRQGTILPVPADEHNHTIDAVAYAMGKLLEPRLQTGYRRLADPYL